MIYGIQIGDHNTLTDWGLILASDLSVGEAAIKTEYVNIPGADGQLDFSEALSGGPVYKNRTIKFILFCKGDIGDYMTAVNALIAYCHGQIRKLWLPTDNTHYYKGRFSVSYNAAYGQRQISISVNAEPYAYKNATTTQTITIPSAGTKTVTLVNEARKVVPVFHLNSGSITVGGHALQSGDNQFDDIVLVAGNNSLTLTGANGSSCTISYQEARL